MLDVLEPLVREQYLDFAKCRRFRQTLLCHEASGDRSVGRETIAGFASCRAAGASRARPTSRLRARN